MIETSRKTNNKRSRRRFFHLVWMGLGGVALVEFFMVCASFLKPNTSKTSISKPEEIIGAGHRDDFAIGSVTPFVRGQFYLIRLDDGGIIAVSSRCTHLGCSVPWDDEKKEFICPCHASRFNIRGEVLSSPAPRSMDAYTVVIKNNKIYVHVGNKMTRRKNSKTKAAYPDTIEHKS